MAGVELQFLDPADRAARDAWDETVKNSPRGTIFHTTAWMDVIRTGLGLEPRFAYLSDKNGSVRALVPLFCAGSFVRPQRWLNLPQSCSSDPLAYEEIEAVDLLEQLARAADARGAVAIALRTSQRLEPAVSDGWEVRREQTLLRHVLDLRGASNLRTLPRIQRRQREKFSASMRRLDSGNLTLHLAQPAEADLFARAVHKILLRRHGHLGMPAQFFRALLEFLPDAARLAMIRGSSGSVLGFTSNLWARDCCNFLYGAGLPTAQGADAYRALLGAEIEAAIGANLLYFDLHETSPDLEGLIDFKDRLGAERVDGSYFVIAKHGAQSGLRDISSRRMAMIQRIFRYVPVDVSLKIAGPVHRALQ